MVWVFLLCVCVFFVPISINWRTLAFPRLPSVPAPSAPPAPFISHHFTNGPHPWLKLLLHWHWHDSSCYVSLSICLKVVRKRLHTCQCRCMSGSDLSVTVMTVKVRKWSIQYPSFTPSPCSPLQKLSKDVQFWRKLSLCDVTKGTSPRRLQQCISFIRSLTAHDVKAVLLLVFWNINTRNALETWSSLHWLCYSCNITVRKI